MNLKIQLPVHNLQAEIRLDDRVIYVTYGRDKAVLKQVKKEMRRLLEEEKVPASDLTLVAYFVADTWRRA